MLTLASFGEIHPAYWLAPFGAVAALVMARVFTGSIMQRSEGDDEMVRIAAAVRAGAMAYLKRQYRVVAMVFVALIVFLGIMAAMGLQPVLSMLGVPVAGLLSGICGWVGMKMATNASARTANAAKQSLNDGLTVAFRSGAVMGLNVVGFALLDASLWFLLLNILGPSIGLTGGITELTTIMLSFAMGASTQALFARVGGGIYTKAADVGADLVGKVEAGIPEDDARNPATIADNVGDNVGDVAGMGADLYESYYGSILSTMALGAAAAFTVIGLTPGVQGSMAVKLAVTPLALAGIGILCSIAGIFAIKAKEDSTFAQLLAALGRGVYVASGLIVLAAFAVLYFLLGPNSIDPADLAAAGTSWWRIGLAIVAGLAAGLVIARATEYYTSYEHPPTRRIAIQAQTGPATVIIGGIAEGMKSTWAGLLTTVVAIIAAFVLAGGGENFLMGLYGVAIAAVGMLATLGITLATDAYGPIADNAGGNAEMTGQPPHVRERTDMLDSLGNTTAATGKGFAIGSAALTALALFAAYIQVVQVQLTRQCALREQRATAVTPATDSTYAVYQGHGRFAVVYPNPTAPAGATGNAALNFDGALFIESAANIRGGHGHFDLDNIPVGTRFTNLVPAGIDPDATITPDLFDDSTHYTLIHTTSHADHTDTVTFDLVSTSRGTLQDVLVYYNVTLANPRVLGGLFIGVLLTFLFCAMTMSAVGRAAYAMMGECRRQFAKMREAFRAQGMTEDQIADPTNWPKQVDFEGKHYPDYATCVSISTAGAQREMVVPSILAIGVPIALGLILDVPGVMGMLAGGLTSGFAVAVFMANAGGAWDNAKKLIESYGRISADKWMSEPSVREKIPAEIRDALTAKAQELVRTGKGKTYVYGKGSDDHKATVVGDTVGDPFKDTSGPALNILIKLISIVSVVFAGLIVAYGPVVGQILGLD